MRTNKELIEHLIQAGYLKTPRIIEAFRAIDRADFVLPEYSAQAYEDHPLPIGEGQTISQPLTVAFMLELLEPKPGEKILDVGSGSGWTSALLAYIVSRRGAKGQVVSVERIPKLSDFGRRNISKYNFIKKGIVRHYCGDGTQEIKEEALFDKILAGAAADKEIPKVWKKELRVGGRIVVPMDNSVVVLIKKSTDLWEEKSYPGFVFVPLIKDKQKPRQSGGLKEYSETDNTKEIGSQKKGRCFFKILTLFIGFLFFTIAILANEIYFVHSSLSSPTTVVIKPGLGSRKIGELLKKKGIIRSKWAFVTYVTLAGSASKLKPGEYTFYKEPIPQISALLTAGSVQEVRIVIREGWTIYDIADFLDEKGVISASEFLKYVQPGPENRALRQKLASRFEFLAEIPEDVGLEGYLFPDTYRVFKHSKPEDVVIKMLENLDRKLAAGLEQKIKEQKMTIFETLTIASLIEKEVISSEDRKLVSGIIHKRLKIGMPLQIDASITYITGKRTTRVSIADTKIESPYNTYLNLGLPIGPVSNPGLDAIEAALYPKKSPYLYYLTTPEGKTIFSSTLKEHNIAKAKYLD